MRFASSLHKIIHKLVNYSVILGGVVLLAIVVLTSVSVAGREINGFAHWDMIKENMPFLSQWIIDSGIASFNGDYEILEAGIAFTIFAFLPICQFYGGHATVDIFTSKLPTKYQRLLIGFWEFILAAIIITITWQLFKGLVTKFNNQETTFMLRFPVWWAYGASFIAAFVSSLVAVYCVVARVMEIITNNNILPKQEEAH